MVPVSLTCGHSVCKKCLMDSTVTICPFDLTVVTSNTELPPNGALLWFLEEKETQRGKDHSEDNLPMKDRAEMIEIHDG